MITFFCLNRNEASNFVPLQSAQTAAAVYDIDWYRRDVREQKKILYIILRSQKDEAIRISGIVPQLSLPHYMKVHASCLLFCLLCTFNFTVSNYSFTYCSIYTRLYHTSMHCVLWYKSRNQFKFYAEKYSKVGSQNLLLSEESDIRIRSINMNHCNTYC